MTSISAAIMAHPDRSRFVTELRSKLDRDVPVVWDERNDRWDTGSRAMAVYDPTATHHLVLQDDAVIPHDLLAGLEKALARVPDEAALCLYFGKVKRSRTSIWRIINRTRADTSWVVTTHLNWGVGIVLPTRHIKEMLSWANMRSDIANYDIRIGRWLQHNRIPVYYPWPSLVDHRNSPSLVPGRNGRGRRAYAFIGENASALDFKADGGTIRVAQAGETIRSRRSRFGS